MTSDILISSTRPTTLSEVIGQKDNVKRLQAYVKAKNMPHLRMEGPPGTGKTSACEAFARDLYGDDWKDYVLKLNASDDRGIDVIRNTVIKYATLSTKYNEVDFKIIILEEFDSMTNDAQDALRYVMERYSYNTRFILLYNLPHKIRTAIKSRTFPMIFGPLTDEEVVEGITKVIKVNKIVIPPEGVQRIAQRADGSLRDAINLIDGMNIGSDNEIDMDTINAFVGKDEPGLIGELFKACIGGDFKVASQKYIELRYGNKLQPAQILRQIAEFIDSEPYTSPGGYFSVLAKYEDRINHGADPYIQMKGMIAELAMVE